MEVGPLGKGAYFSFRIESKQSGRNADNIITLRIEKMNLLFRLFNSARYRASRIIFGRIANQRVSRYLKDNNLDKVIRDAKCTLGATGADDSDYVLLHSFIRNRRPRYVLECGTGMTTWVIADALQKNWNEDGQPTILPTVVSMEDNEEWFSQASQHLPDSYRSFVDLRRSERVYDHYSFIFGVRYADIPDHPYELMWVDGPVARYTQRNFRWEDEDYEHICILDLVRLLQRRDLNITVMIDNLKRTQIAYTCLFKRKSIRSFPFWSSIGVMESVTRSDLIIDTEKYIANYQKIVPMAKPWKTPSFFRN